MRVSGSWSLLLAASFTSSLALAQPAAPAPPPEATPAEPSAVESSPAATLATPSSPAASSPAARDTDAVAKDATATRSTETESATRFVRNYHALPLTLEARLGFNARLGSSFDDATDEERWGATYAFAAYLAWQREFALGLELDHSGLGSVRALSGQNSIDNQYTATGAWLGARVFPIRRERFDFFVNLRVGMVFQHVDAFGTRASSGSITEPAQSYSCSEWDGPGIGLGGALGIAYRLGRHLSFVSRVDLTGARLNGEALGTCADGIGSVASLSGSVGLAFEFETAPK
jgi:hypothetical protein